MKKHKESYMEKARRILIDANLQKDDRIPFFPTGDLYFWAYVKSTNVAMVAVQLFLFGTFALLFPVALTFLRRNPAPPTSIEPEFLVFGVVVATGIWVYSAVNAISCISYFRWRFGKNNLRGISNK